MIRVASLRGKPLTFNYIHPEMMKVLNVVGVWSMRAGIDVLWTSANDHEHSDASLHYSDWAYDFDIPNVSDLQRLYAFVTKNLGPGYDVIFEGSHIHVEFEPGKQRSGKS